MPQTNSIDWSLIVMTIVLLTALVLVMVALGFSLLDPLVGVAIAMLIAHTSYKIARDASGILSDKMVLDEEDIRNVVMSVPEVLGCHVVVRPGC